MFRYTRFRYTRRDFLLTTLSIFLVLSCRSAKAEELSIVGTGDGFVIVSALAKAFNDTHGAKTVLIPPSIGSSGGIKAVGNGQFALGRVARRIKDREKGYGLTYMAFAKFPIVFFVNESVAVDSLTTDQVVQIFAGNIKNWREVGGDDEKIRVVRREDGDSSLQNLRKTLPGFGQIAITVKSKTTTTTQDNFAIVAELPRAIGFGPYPDALQSPVKVLRIDGKMPTAPGYASFTELALVYKAENMTGLVAEFIEFLKTDAARRVIRQYGGLPK